MATVTIPREFVKNKNLVAVPKEAYEEFLTWQKKMKSVRVFEPTAREKRLLAQGRKNLRQGKYASLETLRHELATRR